MRLIDIKRFDGGTDSCPVFDLEDFPYGELDTKALNCKHKKHPKSFCQTFATFDIETTTIDDFPEYRHGKRKKTKAVKAPYGFMYIWQMSVGGYVCIGRTWEEWIEFLSRLKAALNISEERGLVIYVHNLAYEFQFIRDFLNAYEGGFEIFAPQKRKPLHIFTGSGLQFRCSYRLTNMTLQKACENEKGVVHCKAAGDLDYRICRTPHNSELSDEELGYCVSDVVCLYELIENRLKNEHDTLESIPMTSTGYVRREVRNSTRKDGHYRDFFKANEMTAEVYQLLREAARGGNTHANRLMSGRKWQHVASRDEASAYPAVQLLRKFPRCKFVRYGEIENMAELEKLLNDKACLFRLYLLNPSVRLGVSMPYIPIDKCRNLTGELSDNGRVLKAAMLSITVTDIDFKIIRQQYEWETMMVSDMFFSEYDYLPECVTNPVLEFFRQKTELKWKIQEGKKNGATKEELADLNYYYAKAKNRLNSIFGMMYTNPIHTEISLDGSGQWIEKEPDIPTALKKFFRSRNNFLVYSWGVWTTVHARAHLQRMIDITDISGTLYCDTDSSKFLYSEEVEKLLEEENEKIRKECEERGAFAEAGGRRYYLGLYEDEGIYNDFKTLGAKKYCYDDEDGFHITISGVDKKAGAVEMGSIDNFVPGFIFHQAGGLELYYNDMAIGIHQITVNGDTFTTGSNVGMIESTYELGITDEYAELIGGNVFDLF